MAVFSLAPEYPPRRRVLLSRSVGRKGQRFFSWEALFSYLSLTTAGDSSILSPKGNVQAVSFSDAFGLCERGMWREASEAAAGIASGTERTVIEGCVLALTRPEAAKDVLTKAMRSLPEGEIKEIARLWLARCYWATGETKEARIMLDSVNTLTDDLRFLVGLNRSIFEPTKLATSIASLAEIEGLVDLVAPLRRARFFLQRGWLMRRLGKTDSAIVDYEAARYWFERADSPRSLAAAANNVAGLLIDTKRFEDAHAAVDSARAQLPRSDTLYLAQVEDQDSLIFLAEGKYAEALKCAGRSVDMLSDLENKELLAKSLITHAKALSGNGEYVRALVQLDRAKEIALYLGDKSILLKATKEQREAAQKLGHASHRALVETALKIADGSLRGAARLVGCSAPALDRFIELHGIKRHPKVRKSVIVKSHK